MPRGTPPRTWNIPIHATIVPSLARLILPAACAAFIAACASLPDTGPLESGEFELSGRVAVRYGTEAASGRIDWRHSKTRDDMLITNPIGQGIATLKRNDGEVVLQTADTRIFRAPDAESLTEQVLGWQIPLTGLPFWVRARAASGPAELGRDDTGRITRIVQDGWQIDCRDYEDQRPTRVVLKREGLEIRLFIDRWSEGAS